MSPSLPEDRRTQLDGIVQQMTQNGEPDENISAVVNDFKQKYAGPPPTPEQQFSSAQKDMQARLAANTKTPAQKALSTVQQFGQNIWNAAKGTAGLIADVGAASQGDPMATQRIYGSVVDPQWQQLKKAGEAATGTGEFKGAPAVSRVAGTVGHGLAGVTPGIGPLAARGGEKGGQGDIPGAIADIGTAAAMGVAPEYIGKGVGAVAGKVRDFTTPNPDTTLYQAIGQGIRQEMPDYYDMSPIVRGDIKRAATATGAELKDIPTTLKATQAAKAENRGVMDMHVDPYRQSGWRGQGDPIADEIVNAIPATLRARAQAGIPEAVAEVQRIAQEANVYRRPFTPDEIFGLSREFNAGLNNFFNGTADMQHALIGKGGDVSALEAAARGNRNLIRSSFGDDVADLQRRWGYLDDVETALRQKWKAVTKSPEETPASDLDAAMLKAGIPGKLTHGDVSGAKFAFRGGKTDSLLQDTFNNTEPGWPLPTPQPSGMPGVGGMPRAVPPNRQLPPATPQIQPPGGGYVSGSGGMPPGAQQNVWQGRGAPRQLPAGQAPFTQGTSAVNPAANPPKMPYNAGLLPPGSPTQGQGVTQVPLPGAANQGTLQQIPPAPRTAAAPADTSGVSYYGSEPLVASMAKQVWEATKPKVEEAPAPVEAAAPAPAPKPKPTAAPARVDTRLEKALGTLKEGMANVRQAPPGGSERGSFSNRPTRQAPPGSQDIDAQMRYGTEETPEVAQYLGHDLESRITNAYNQLDSGDGNTVTFYRLKQALPDVPKQEFDQAVVRMTKGKNSPFLASVHDSAPRMAAMGQDVSDFVFDPSFDPAKEVGGTYMNRETAPKGQYYVSMYKRPK